MRIIGYIEHPNLKITIFKMNNRLSVKFESGLYEETYKFRESEEISSLEHIKKIVDADFLCIVERNLAAMHQTKMAALSRYLPAEEEEEFAEII